MLETRDAVTRDEEQLRNRLPAVIADLGGDGATAELGEWLATVTFAQFHLHEVPAAGVQGTVETIWFLDRESASQVS